MEIGAMGAGPSVTDVLALKQEQTAQAAGVALLGKSLDVQTRLAAQLFQSLGIGGNVDVKA